MKMLSMQRPLPSIETRTPARLRVSVQANAVNWLGHSKIESKVRYLGVDIEDALTLSERTDV